MIWLLFVFLSICLIVFCYPVTKVQRGIKLYCSDEDFALWAFGDVWHAFMVLERDHNDLKNAWNKRHGDLMKIEDDDLIRDSLDKMKEFYQQREKTNG